MAVVHRPPATNGTSGRTGPTEADLLFREARQRERRRRLAWLGVVVSVVGVVAAIVATTRPSPTSPPHSSKSAASSRSKSIGVLACVASELSASGSWQGATGSLLGDLVFTNTGKEPCSLVGYLRITLVDQRGQALPVQLRKGRPAAELHPLATPMLVALGPGEPRAASVMLQWFNWCGPSPGRVSVIVALASGAHLSPVAMGTGGSRCDDFTDPSFLTEGPVQIPPS